VVGGEWQMLMIEWSNFNRYLPINITSISQQFLQKLKWYQMVTFLKQLWSLYLYIKKLRDQWSCYDDVIRDLVILPPVRAIGECSSAFPLPPQAFVYADATYTDLYGTYLVRACMSHTSIE